MQGRQLELAAVVDQAGVVAEREEPGQATNCETASTEPPLSAAAPTLGSWFSTDTSSLGSIPSFSSAWTRVPCPADPTLAEMLASSRSESWVTSLSSLTTTPLSAPCGL